MVEGAKIEVFFVGVLQPVREGLYRLCGPFDGQGWHVQPPASQELRVYLERKDAMRRHPALPV